MLRYIVQRCLLAIVTMWVISVLAFVIIQLPPGDYVTSYIRALEEAGGVHEDDLARALRREYGLDQPIYVQYWRWVRQFARGQFGSSMLYRLPVREVIASRLGMTVIVTLASIAFSWLVALPIGIYSAVKQYSVGDYLATFIALLGVAVPDFLLALVVLFIAFVYFNVSAGGLFSSTEMYLAPWSWPKIVDLLKHLWLPSIIVGLSSMAGLVRTMRNNLLDELGKPYVMTARAKGLSQSRAILKYPVRVALNPFVSTVGYVFPQVVSGGIIVAIIMSLPTVGPTLYSALLAQDMFLAGTIILLISLMTVIGTLVSDILLVWVDPRIRLGQR
jgi:peptide/nickel transport system permease protein